jgi:beta-galactosidase
MIKKTVLIQLIALLTVRAGVANAQTKLDINAKQFFLFSYFVEQDAGVNLAISTNGINWLPVNHGKVVATPQVGEKLIRDPSINLGADGIFRMVWTTGWKGKNIGYAESKDPAKWGEEKAIPVGSGIDSTNNCWAPEIFFNPQKKNYMIYWSSNIGPWKKGGEGRIYFVTTKDFKVFSKPAVLFRNGSPAGGAAGNQGPIDAFIYKDHKRYLLFYKKDDNTHIPNIYYRASQSPEGPWGDEHGPVTPSTGDEGPSIVKIGSNYCMFTDPFESDFAYMFTSKDLNTWKRQPTDLKMAHGTVIEISKQTALKLLNE